MLLCALSPYLYISQFAHPIADDYGFAVRSMNYSFIENLTYLFFNMGGRYTTNALILLNPLAFHSLTLYKIIPAFQIALTVVSFYYFFRSLMSRALSRIDSLNVSLLFVLLYLFQMPSLAEGIYFYTSAANYQTGIIVSLFYFGLLYNYFKKKYIAHQIAHISILLLVLLIATGFSEVITLVLVYFHLAVVFLLYKQKKKIDPAWLLILFACLLFSLVMLLAPGNSVRSSSYPDNHNFFHSLILTCMQIFRFGFEWMSSLPLLLCSFLFAGTILSNREKISFLKQEYFLTPWVSVLFHFAILFLCIFPPYWGTNILGQHRTVNIACFFFFLYWFICIGIYTNRYFEKMNLDFLLNKKIRLVAIVLIVCTLFTTKNGYTLFYDIWYSRVNIFSAQMNGRFIILSKKENREKGMILKPLSEKPKSLFILDLTKDSTDWINSCQAKYFGVPSIICKE